MAKKAVSVKNGGRVNVGSPPPPPPAKSSDQLLQEHIAQLRTDAADFRKSGGPDGERYAQRYEDQAARLETQLEAQRKATDANTLDPFETRATGDRAGSPSPVVSAGTPASAAAAPVAPASKSAPSAKAPAPAPASKPAGTAKPATTKAASAKPGVVHDAVLDWFSKNDSDDAWLLDNTSPQVIAVMQQYANGEVDQGRFSHLLDGTDFFQNHTALDIAYRQVVAQNTKNGSPNATLQALVGNHVDYVQKIASQAGVPISADQAKSIADLASHTGWGTTDAESLILRQIALADVNPSGGTGSIGAKASEILNKARGTYFMPLDQGTANDLAKSFFEGRIQDANIDGWLKDHAASTSPTMKAIIGQGFTPSQYFAPITNKAAGLLGVAPATIDWVNDPLFQSILSTHPDSKQPPRPMTMDEATRAIRSDPRFLNSVQGQAANAQVASTINAVMTEPV